MTQNNKNRALKTMPNVSYEKDGCRPIATVTLKLAGARSDIFTQARSSKNENVRKPPQNQSELIDLKSVQQKQQVHNSKLQLSKNQMRDYGYKIIDQLVEHFDQQTEKSPVCSASPQQMEELLIEDIPSEPTDANEVLIHVMDNVLSNCGLTSHPRAFSCVPGPSNFISVMADVLASGFNIFSGSWRASPAATQIEIMLINWLLKLFGFDVKTGGGLFTSGGSMANLTALATARQVKCKEDFSKATVYLSDQAHSSNIKALRILGFSQQQIKIIPTDSDFKISISKLKHKITIDKQHKRQPFCLIASAGTTNTGAIDPFKDLGKICKSENIWLHVDGAYGGGAILAGNGKQLLKGIGNADSITVDPHKWFYQPYEMGCVLVKEQRFLTKTFTEKPEYLRDLDGGRSEVNYFDHGIQLTRNFKALKLYMSLKTFGQTAFKEAVEYNLDLTEQVQEILANSRTWEIISPASLAVISFRYNPVGLHYSAKELDNINQSISNQVMASGFASLTTTVLRGQVVLRMCLINPRTTLNDVTETLKQCEYFAGLTCAKIE